MSNNELFEICERIFHLFYFTTIQRVHLQKIEFQIGILQLRKGEHFFREFLENLSQL